MTTRHVNNPRLAKMHTDYRAKLAAENAHAEVLRAQQVEIVARAEAARAAKVAWIPVVAHRYAIALAKANRRNRQRQHQESIETLPLFQLLREYTA